MKISVGDANVGLTAGQTITHNLFDTRPCQGELDERLMNNWMKDTIKDMYWLRSIYFAM